MATLVGVIAVLAWAFAATIERDRQRAKPRTFPSEREVSYDSSEEIPAESSTIAVSTRSQGTHTIVCMEPYESEVRDFHPFGVGSDRRCIARIWILTWSYPWWALEDLNL